MARNDATISGGQGFSRTRTQPIAVPRTTRRMDVRCLTSLPAGRVVPIWVCPLLREDQMMSTRLRVNFEMHETVEVLMNAINVSLKAYLVPNLAFPRFDGMDELNRSYAKVIYPSVGGTVTPYFETVPFNSASNKVLWYLGKHARASQPVNTAYNEAYNLIWNMRAKNRSPDIMPRLLTDHSLAKAFWQHQRFAHIVPDFDQALIDGEVPLNVTSGNLPVTGIGTTLQTGAANISAYETGKTTSTTYPFGQRFTESTNNPATAALSVKMGGASAAFPQIFAELKQDGITVSLSNIEMARRTQAFAALRKQYHGYTDEWIIDMMMSGLTIPDQDLRQPMLIAEENTIFGMSKRYASDSLDLTASVANGATFIDVNLRTPRVPTGGVVMVTVEITPEQLFERQMDPYLVTSDQATLPDFLRDTLDPEKVEVVENQYVDMAHATPTGTFGYAPLGYKWATNGPNIGGRFYRPAADAAFDEDRQRIWAVETLNPTLAEDFYLCSVMHTKPFVVTNEDPFDAITRGLCTITGNTVFGRALIEASDDYEQVMEEAPMGRIPNPGVLDAGVSDGDGAGTEGETA